jgi:hypothetical protein
MAFINTIQNLDMIWPISFIQGRKHTPLCFTLNALQGVLQNSNNRQTVLWHTLQFVSVSWFSDSAMCSIRYFSCLWSCVWFPGPNDPPVKWATWVPSPGVKQTACEADTSPNFQRIICVQNEGFNLWAESLVHISEACSEKPLNECEGHQVP